MFSERIWNNNNHSKRYPFGMPTTENRAKLKDPRIYHPINQVDESSKMQRVNVFQQRLNKGMKPNIPKQYKELLSLYIYPCIYRFYIFFIHHLYM